MVAPEQFSLLHRDFGELAREESVLRCLHLPGSTPVGRAMVYTAVRGVALERFLRSMAAHHKCLDGGNITLSDLLNRACAAPLKRSNGGPVRRNIHEECTHDLPLLRMPFDPPGAATLEINTLRNVVCHGNYEAAAQRHGLADMGIYFRKHFHEDLLRFDLLSASLLEQFDPQSGQPVMGPIREVPPTAVKTCATSISGAVSLFAVMSAEHNALYQHNLTFTEGSSHETLCLFSEGVAVCVAMERLLREKLGYTDGSHRPLWDMLTEASQRGLIAIPWDDPQDGIDKICGVKDTLLHGNYEQAANGANKSGKKEYFQTSYAAEIDCLRKILWGFTRLYSPL